MFRCLISNKLLSNICKNVLSIAWHPKPTVIQNRTEKSHFSLVTGFFFEGTRENYLQSHIPCLTPRDTCFFCFTALTY
jgi:hypothetical protein